MKQLVDKRAIELETISGRKIIRDVRALGVSPLSTNVTPLQLLQSGQGSFPLGMYKGGLAVTDLDKAVNQPLVKSEKEFIAGVFDGRLAGYDVVTATAIGAAAIGTVYRARLTVPAGQVWYMSNMEIGVPKDTTCTFDINWRCSLWPDVVAVGGTPDADGQAYLPSDIVGTNAALTHKFAFGPAPITTNAFATFIATGTLKPLSTLIRLPGGAVLTLQATVRTNVVVLASVAITMSIAGYIGKALVS